MLPVLIDCPRTEKSWKSSQRGCAPGPRIKLGCGGKESAGPCHFHRQNQLGRSTEIPTQSGMSSRITINILSLLHRAALLSAVCSGGSSCARRGCASGHKNICLDPLSYSSSLLNLTAIDIWGSFIEYISCRVRIFFDSFLHLIHSNGQSQEGCGCSLVVA